MDTPPTLTSQIRRRFAAALAAAWLLMAALIAAWLVFAAGETPAAVLVLIGLLVTGGAAGSILLLRPLLRWLQALERFERALLSAGQAQVYRPLELTSSGAGEQAAEPGISALYAAYNALIRRSVESSAKIFKYLSHMYHEGNTLLASILGYGSMVADNSLRPDDANLEEYGQIIVDQARCSAGLLEDFTLAARIEGGQYAPVPRPVRLVPLLLALVEELAEQSGREITLSGDLNGAVLNADALSLEKALRKLLENALKFSPPGSPVQVTVEKSETPHLVRMHITDQGAGIAAEDLAGLFQPFARGKQEAARRVPGYGLGLFIAYAIVRAHLGEISVRSSPGAGATFTVTLPVEGTNG